MKKRILKIGSSIWLLLFLIPTGVLMSAFVYYIIGTLEKGTIIVEVINGIYMFCIVYMIIAGVSRSFVKYVITPEYIAEKNFYGKVYQKVYLDEIVDVGIVPPQGVHKMTKYIYLSKKHLSDEEKRNILMAGSDGNINFFRYSAKLQKYINKFRNM